MRTLLLVMVVLAGCADEDARGPIVIQQTEQQPDASKADMAGGDVCDLAAQLPADDICSLVCDPDAMAAQLIADGSDRGACYQLSCTLPGEQRVLVGVCLPP